MNKRQNDVTEQGVQKVHEVMQEPEGGWPADEYTGKAGSYVRDPLTGVRRPVADVVDGDAAAAA